MLGKLHTVLTRSFSLLLFKPAAVKTVVLFPPVSTRRRETRSNNGCSEAVSSQHSQREKCDNVSQLPAAGRERRQSAWAVSEALLGPRERVSPGPGGTREQANYHRKQEGPAGDLSSTLIGPRCRLSVESLPRSLWSLSVTTRPPAVVSGWNVPALFFRSGFIQPVTTGRSHQLLCPCSCTAPFQHPASAKALCKLLSFVLDKQNSIPFTADNCTVVNLELNFMSFTRGQVAMQYFKSSSTSAALQTQHGCDF